MPTPEELRVSYSKFTDDKLLKIASQEAGSLTPEGLQILKEEVEKRGLSQDLSAGIAVQTAKLADTAVNEYIDLVRSQPCPHCNSTRSKLNGTVVGEVVSVIFFSQYTKNAFIGCPPCLVSRNKSGFNKSLALGWWGFPWGIVYTIRSLIFNNKMMNQAQQPESNDILYSFVLSKIGAIEIAKNNPEKLRSLLLNFKL